MSYQEITAPAQAGTRQNQSCPGCTLAQTPRLGLMTRLSLHAVNACGLAEPTELCGTAASSPGARTPLKVAAQG